jgi:uncharacterized protein involved in outer membrane biogenesis
MRLATVGGGLLLAAVVALGLLIAGRHALLEWAIPRASRAALERTAALESARIDWRGGISLAVEGLRIANPAWADEENLLAVEHLEVVVDAKALLGAELRLREVRAQEPRLYLARADDGERTWSIGAREGPAPMAAAGWPRWLSIERARITDGRIAVRDPDSGLDARGEKNK